MTDYEAWKQKARRALIAFDGVMRPLCEELGCDIAIPTASDTSLQIIGPGYDATILVRYRDKQLPFQATLPADEKLWPAHLEHLSHCLRLLCECVDNAPVIARPNGKMRVANLDG